MTLLYTGRGLDSNYWTDPAKVQNFPGLPLELLGIHIFSINVEYMDMAQRSLTFQTLYVYN